MNFKSVKNLFRSSQGLVRVGVFKNFGSELFSYLSGPGWPFLIGRENVRTVWIRSVKTVRRKNSPLKNSPFCPQSLFSKKKSQNSTFYLWFHLKVHFLSEFEFALYRHFVLSSLSVNFWTEICRQLGARQSENTFDLIGLLRFSAVSLKSLHISTN